MFNLPYVNDRGPFTTSKTFPQHVASARTLGWVKARRSRGEGMIRPLCGLECLFLQRGDKRVLRHNVKWHRP